MAATDTHPPIAIAKRLSERTLLLNVDLLELLRGLLTIPGVPGVPKDAPRGCDGTSSCVHCGNLDGHEADCPWVLARWVVLNIAEPRRHHDPTDGHPGDFG